MNLKRLYITGPDGAGKSTLAANISLITGIPVTKFSYEPDEEKRKLQWEAYDNIVESLDDCILDRAWFGAMCYDGVLGGQHYDVHKIIALSRAFVESGGTILFLSADVETLKRRIARRGDEYINESQLQKIHENYKMLRGLLHFSKIPYFLLDTTNA